MERILFVDDEERLLAGMARNLRKEFEIHTALSGQIGLDKLAQDGPFPVIVSDMQMPEMNGIEFLVRVKKQAPESIRIMLTGNADQQTAVEAINTGDVHRFLNKPCDVQEMVAVLHEAAETYRRRKIERDMLERTVQGAIDVLVQVLSLTNPVAFGRSARLADLAVQIAEQMGVDDPWVVRAASLLSQIGCVNLPDRVVAAIAGGNDASASERAAFAEHPELGSNLIARIPRLEPVAEAIRYQNKNFNGTGAPGDATEGYDIPVAARILRVVLEFDVMQSRGMPNPVIVDRLHANGHLFDAAVLESLQSTLHAHSTDAVRRVAVNELTPTMVLAEDIHDTAGVLLVCRGWGANESVIRHLIRAAEKGAIDGEVLVQDT